MRILAIAVVLLLHVGGHAQAEWELLATDTTGIKTFYNASRTKKTPDGLVVWIEYRSPRAVPVFAGKATPKHTRSMHRMLLNCREDTTQNMYIVFYDKDTSVFTQSSALMPAPVIPGTTGELVLRTICNREAAAPIRAPLTGDSSDLLKSR